MNSACGATVVGSRLPFERARIGEVERLEDVVEAATYHGQIDRRGASTSYRVVPLAAGVVDVGVILGGQQRAAHRRIELAADGEDRVAHRLGFESATIHPPEQPVLGIGQGQRRVCTACSFDRSTRA